VAGRTAGAGCLETSVEDLRFAIRYVQIAPGSEVQVPAAQSRRTWTVLSGVARIHEAHSVSALAEGEAHAQPAGTAARLTNSGDRELVMIEALSEKAALPAMRRFAIAAE
jgi:mannose-6-phosphate isomerase-like protein (cupin superfamily)